jgi:hypothetical protein
VRKHLPLVASIWLLFQGGVLALSPFIECGVSSASQAVTDEDECCKGMAPGQICPLHKHQRAPKNDTRRNAGTNGPVVGCGCRTLDPALASLAVGLGEPPSSVSSFVSVFSHPVDGDTFHPLERIPTIDTPPPRA